MKVLPPLFMIRLWVRAGQACVCGHTKGLSARPLETFGACGWGKGERLPLGVLECRPLLPSVARPTIQSILRGSLSLPLATMCMRKKNGEIKTRAFPPRNNVYAKKRETRDRDALCPHLIPEKSVGILSYLSVPLVLQSCWAVIFAHRLRTSRRGAAGVARWMDGLVGRATEGSSGRLSRTPRATPAV